MFILRLFSWKIGYARVSTQELNVDVQIEQLKSIGCEKISLEQVSGKPSWQRAADLLLTLRGKGTLFMLPRSIA